MHKKTVAGCGLAVIFIALLLAALCTGRYAVSLPDVLRIMSGREAADPRAATVVLSFRLPRVLLAALAGAGLSAAGTGLQAMFANPLVSSHILGVSASAGFGAALGILLFGHGVAVQALAIAFGFGGIALVCALGQRRGRTDILPLILSGVVVTALFEAFTSLVKYIADPEEKLPAISYYLMGSLSRVTTHDVLAAAPPIVAGIAALWLLRWQLNVISLDEDEARSLGVNLRLARALIIIASTVIAAVTVSVCGIISFVGLAAPHFARMCVGSDHTRLLGASVLTGSIFLLAVDTLCRSAASAEIPLSIVTAVFGAPVFIILLRRTGGLHDNR